MKYARGFSLIEILVVACLLVIFTGLGAVVSIPAIRNAEFHRVRETVRSELVSAQADAMNGTFDSMWGVAFTTSTITRYRGSSYASRVTAFDRVTTFDNVLLSGATDISFARLTGAPSGTATIVITNGTAYATTTVSAVGTIDTQ